MARQVVRVKLRLAHVRPRVTRVFDMHTTSTLGELHLAIQAVMPWEESHLHQFEVGDALYVDPGHGWGDFDDDHEYYDQDSTTLGAVIGSGFTRLNYVYDMGDYWEHSIELSRSGTEVAGITYPRLVAGARACPLEDSGGPPGHERLLAALSATAESDEFDEGETASLLQWAGEFDPEAFDAAEAQARLDMTFGHGPARSGGWGDWEEPLRLGERGFPARPGAISASLADLPAERFDVAPLVHDAVVVLQLLADEPAPATKSGALSVKSVLRICDAIGVQLWDPSVVRSEADIPEIELVHAVLDFAGLVRRRGAFIALTPRGMLLADSGRRAELAATLMRTRFEELDLGYSTLGGHAPLLQQEYLVTLSRLREVARDWVSMVDIWRDAISSAAKMQCVAAFAHEPSLLVELRLIRPFVEMGLIEACDSDDSNGGSRFRCTPLLGDWVHFDSQGGTAAVRERLLARPTIQEALERFLEERIPALPSGMRSSYRSNVECLQHYLDGYGPNCLSSEAAADWESLQVDEDPPRFSEVFGPERIALEVGMYLTWFLPKKVGVSEDAGRKAARFAADLLAWLIAEGHTSAEDAEIAVEDARAARSSLPAAARFGRVAREWCDSLSVVDDGDMIEDEFEILRVESDVLWLASYLTGEEYGPSPVPEHVASAARPGMQFSGSIVPRDGVWCIAELWTVYPG